MIISTDNSAIRNEVGDLAAMRLIKDAGFDGIDYSFYGMRPDNDILALPDGERAELAGRIRDEADRIGIRFPQCHAELKYALGTIGTDESDRAFLRVVRSIEYSSRIGCPQIVIHTMRCPLDMDDETADALNIEFMRRFIPYAEKYGVLIGVENLFKHDKPNKVFYGRQHTAERMNRFVDALGSDLFRVCLDIGHAAICGSDPAEFILGMSPDRLTMLHVQDTELKADRHWLPFLGSHDWDGITGALARIGYDGPFNLEVLHFYDRFPKELFPYALKLADEVSRRLAGEIETKKNKLLKE